VNDLPMPDRSPRPASREGVYVGPVHVTLPLALVGLVMLGSLVFLGWVVTSVRDNQIPMLAYGFVGLGASLVALAVGSLVEMWRAASRSEGGRALGLAIFGGLAGLAAIGSFTVSALSMLVWNT
jgi:hypothetical protein